VSLGCRGWAGITLASFVELNPLVAPQCDTAHGGQGLQVGNAACIGDTIAFCSNVYTATSADTCHSIAKTEVRGP
jgi:PIN domain nuclease of toxin-antitoxin system